MVKQITVHEGTIDDIYRALDDNRSRMVNLRASVQRIDDTFDNASWIRELQGDREQITYNLIQRLHDLVVSPSTFQGVPVVPIAVPRGLKRRPVGYNSRRMHEDTLLECKITISKKTCTCGKHKGLVFRNSDKEVIEENACPLWWWITVKGMLFRGKYNVEEMPPLKEYIKHFELKEKK